MKEIMIIDIQKICKECRFNTSSLCDKSRQDVISCEEGKEDTTVIEQVPETFEELKELCKELKEKINKEIWEMKIEEDFIHIRRIWETKEICFTNAGNMVSNNGWDLLMTNLTPVRQWQIIKNLIGE